MALRVHWVLVASDTDRHDAGEKLSSSVGLLFMLSALTLDCSMGGGSVSGLGSGQILWPLVTLLPTSICEAVAPVSLQPSTHHLSVTSHLATCQHCLDSCHSSGNLVYNTDSSLSLTQPSQKPLRPLITN